MEDFTLVLPYFQKSAIWAHCGGMLLNAIKTKGIIFGRSRTSQPEHPELVLQGAIIENVDKIKLLGVTFDSKITFNCHLRNITSAVSQKIGILRKCWQVYRDDALVLKCFYAFILPFFEYCSSVWMSAASSYLNMLQRVFISA